MRKKYLFIDTNIWISVYKNFDCENKEKSYFDNFEKISNYEKKGFFTILINECLVSEFIENRNKKMSSSFNKIFKKLEELNEIFDFFKREMTFFIKVYDNTNSKLDNFEISPKITEKLELIMNDFYNDNLKNDYLMNNFPNCIIKCNN